MGEKDNSMPVMMWIVWSELHDTAMYFLRKGGDLPADITATQLDDLMEACGNARQRLAETTRGG